MPDNSKEFVWDELSDNILRERKSNMFGFGVWERSDWAEVSRQVKSELLFKSNSGIECFPTPAQCCARWLTRFVSDFPKGLLSQQEIESAIKYREQGWSSLAVESALQSRIGAIPHLYYYLNKSGSFMPVASSSSSSSSFSSFDYTDKNREAGHSSYSNKARSSSSSATDSLDAQDLLDPPFLLGFSSNDDVTLTATDLVAMPLDTQDLLDPSLLLGFSSNDDVALTATDLVAVPLDTQDLLDPSLLSGFSSDYWSFAGDEQVAAGFDEHELFEPSCSPDFPSDYGDVLFATTDQVAYELSNDNSIPNFLVIGNETDAIDDKVLASSSQDKPSPLPDRSSDSARSPDQAHSNNRKRSSAEHGKNPHTLFGASSEPASEVTDNVSKRPRNT